MSARTRRIVAGLAAACLLAGIGPITAAVTGSSGNNTVLWSGNLGLVSGNIGTNSGNLSIRSGNLPPVSGLSGNAGGWLFSGTERGAAAGFARYSGGEWSGLWVEGREFAQVIGNSVVWSNEYANRGGEAGWAYAYRCNPRCTLFHLDRSTLSFSMDPTLERAHFRGVLRQWGGGGGQCWVSVTWRGGDLSTGHALYGYQDPNWIFEGAWASAYRRAVATTSGPESMGACMEGGTKTNHGATYLGLGGATQVTRPMVRLR